MPTCAAPPLKNMTLQARHEIMNQPAISRTCTHKSSVIDPALPLKSHPMFSPDVRHWKAMPTTWSPSSTGPPLLPLLMAASTWMASSVVRPWL
jgi:hypothetical protein